MTRRTIAWWTAILSTMGAASGCGETHDMRTWAEGLGEQAELLRAGEADHARTIEAAIDLAEIGREESRHVDDDTLHVTQMRSLMRDMSEQCSHRHSGAGPEFGELDALATEALAEAERHRTAMSLVADVPAARAEEAVHDAAMGGPLDALAAAVAGVQAAAGNYRCAAAWP